MYIYKKNHGTNKEGDVISEHPNLNYLLLVGVLDYEKPKDNGEVQQPVKVEHDRPNKRTRNTRRG